MKQLVLGIVAAAVMAGCSSKSNFYQLHPQTQQNTAQTVHLRGSIVGVAEVEVADYLDKPQIVTRLSKGHLQLHEEERWVGALDKNIQSMLTHDLSKLLPHHTFLASPWEEPIDDRYRIYVKIDRFDGDVNGTVTLNGRWSLTDREENRLIVGEKVHYVAHGSNTLEGIVTTQSKMIDRLSQEIAKKIRGRI